MEYSHSAIKNVAVDVDLFDDSHPLPEASHALITPGAVLLRGFAREVDVAPLLALDSVVAHAPPGRLAYVWRPRHVGGYHQLRAIVPSYQGVMRLTEGEHDWLDRQRIDLTFRCAGCE